MKSIKKGLATAMTLFLSAALHAAVIGGIMYASGAFTKDKTRDNNKTALTPAVRYLLLPDVEIISDASVLKNSGSREIAAVKKEEFGTKAPEPAQGGQGDKSVFIYQDAVKRRIQEARLYPDDARKEGTQGTAEVSFIILSDGTLKNVSLSRSSGREILDREAVSTIKRASPFPLFDGKLDNGEMTMQVAIIFRLN